MQVRSSRRSVSLPVAFTVFMTLIAGVVLLAFPAAANTDNDPIILSASVNEGALTIEGTYLGVNRPTVQLGGTALEVASFSPTHVVATLPPGGLPAGTYRLHYTRANGLTTDFELTIGAVGPKGDKGDKGDAGGNDPRFGADTSVAVSGHGRECTLGEIILNAGAVANGVPAAGQLLPISQNTALFSLLGTLYGGDGISTFALPDLRGVAPNGLTYSICMFGIYPSRY